MDVDEREDYIVGEIRLSRFTTSNPMTVSYWLYCGVGCLPMDEERFAELRELMREYEKEDADFMQGKRKRWWHRG